MDKDIWLELDGYTELLMVKPLQKDHFHTLLLLDQIRNSTIR